jgi:hypothetical protein
MIDRGLKKSLEAAGKQRMGRATHSGWDRASSVNERNDANITTGTE